MRWVMVTADAGSEDEESLLADDYEPFAVTRETRTSDGWDDYRNRGVTDTTTVDVVWFRKRVQT